MLRFYHKLPYPFRQVAASLRGYELSFLRYSSQTENLVQEAIQRDRWTSEQWKVWQQGILVSILERAAKEVPYYREQWAARRRKGDRAASQYLENWLILEKDALRSTPRAFLANGCDPRKMWNEHTSGTTGKPLSLWQSRQAVREWYALFEARWRRWYGVSRLDRWAILGGQLVTPFEQSRPPYWVWNQGLKQLYLSSYHLSPGNAPFYWEALKQHRVVYILGYASSLYSLALGARQHHLPPIQLRVILSNAEPLYQHQREVISAAFGAPVRDTYGQSENVCAASECEAGQLHLWPEVGIYEVIRDDVDEPVLAGATGRLICTGLLNPQMPLIRYEVGDRVSFGELVFTCSCGRLLPTLRSIEGRQDDVILTPDGRRIARLDPVFKADLPIREAQIIQEDLYHLLIQYIPAAEFTDSDRKLLISRLRDRVGDMSIESRCVDSIPRSANGKFRAVVSHISKNSALEYDQKGETGGP